VKVEGAVQLFRQRNFAQVVTTCQAELATRPDDVELRILLARALMALRRDAEAQAEVSRCLRLRPGCGDAYQLLGELAFRRDELRAAEIFLREALRLNADDHHARVLLDIIQAMTKPAAAAAKLPAATAAAGPSPVADGSAPSALPDRESPAFQLAPRRASRRQTTDRTRPVIEGEVSVAIRIGGGFGEYLVHAHVLTRAQLFSVLHLHYRDRCRVGQAVVKLGIATEETIEEHARRYQDALLARASAS
jgi:tetratricopeptide (TPR) repeat protein